MNWFTTALRRSLWLVLIAAAGGAIWSWRRDAQDASAPAPAEWPPLSTTAPTTPTSDTSDTDTSDTDTGHATDTRTATASFVNALVDAPEARSTNGATGGWVEPDDDGSCPVDFPIKANDNSGIFHVPDGRFYDRTKAERCYSDAAAATADGYRRSKS